MILLKTLLTNGSFDNEIFILLSLNVEQLFVRFCIEKTNFIISYVYTSFQFLSTIYEFHVLFGQVYY